MKHRPNISLNNYKKNTYDSMMEKLSNMVLNGESGSIVSERPVVKAKTKSAPIKKVQPNYLPEMLDYKMEMFDYIASDVKLHPNLLIEYPTYYVATIWTKAPIQGYDSLTSKDFDIYTNGIRLDVIDYKVSFNERGNIVFTMQKDAIGDNLDEQNFLICGAFRDIFLATEINKDIIDTENDLGLVI